MNKKLAPDIRFLLFCVALAIWSFALWFVPHYDYLPDWFPAPSPDTMGLLKCVQPVFLCFAGVLTLSFVTLLFRSILHVGRNAWNGLQTRQKGRILLGVALIVLSLFPWIFGNQIDRYLLDYGLRRYDPIIDAIETYRRDTDTYPQTIETLIPQYLPAYPENYLKFVQDFVYRPTRMESLDYGAFTFYLFGLNTGLSTKFIHYCPESDPSCENLLQSFNAKRIDKRWVLEIVNGQ